LLCATVGLWALRRYLRLLTTAEAVANQADCPRCKAYGRLELMRAHSEGSVAQVRCRGCGHEWRIDS
jgi:Zn ribbon nucleic-acid-binding protein